MTAEQAGQKNCNGKSITNLFHNVFYECFEGKLGICLLLTMSIGDDWMVDLMIIYIEKTIVKGPKHWIFTTFSKKLWGCQLDLEIKYALDIFIL